MNYSSQRIFAFFPWKFVLSQLFWNQWTKRLLACLFLMNFGKNQAFLTLRGKNTFKILIYPRAFSKLTKTNKQKTPENFYAYKKQKRAKTSAKQSLYLKTFIFLQAVSDLLLGVFCMPFTLIGQLLRNFIFGSIMCRLIPYFQGKKENFMLRILCFIKHIYTKFIYVTYFHRDFEIQSYFCFNSLKIYCNYFILF